MTMFAAKEKAASLLGQAIDLAGWLGLAATPVFALMAWISAVGSAEMAICSTASAFMPIDDMALMYLLMGLFHLSPWMKLLAARLQRPSTPLNQPEGN